MKITGEQLELLASQYADASIGVLDRAAFEAQLPLDAEARLLVNQDVRLTQLLRDAHTLPAIDFDNVAARVSKSIASEASHARPSMRFTWGRRLALAACVGIAATVAWRAGFTSIPTDTATSQPPAFVRGPEAERSTGPTLVRINIGPSNDASARAGLALGDTPGARPARVVITAADIGPQYLYEQQPLR